MEIEFGLHSPPLKKKATTSVAFFVHSPSVLLLGAILSGCRCWRARSERCRRSGAPTEALSRRKAETDRVFEGISEGFRSAKRGWVTPGGAEAMSPPTPADPVSTFPSPNSPNTSPVPSSAYQSSSPSPPTSTWLFLYQSPPAPDTPSSPASCDSSPDIRPPAPGSRSSCPSRWRDGPPPMLN